MKKDRNCNMYPTYPMPYMGPMNQGMMIPNMNMGPMVNQNMMSGYSTNSPDYNSLSNQINSLERRVSNLENIVGSNQNYNNSTYQMM